jgi:multiple sugar transport system substrate-binding protein
VSVYRQDLLEKAGVECPATWEELIALGRQGLVCCPSIPLDVYGNFLNLCVSAGDSIFQDCAAVTTTHAGRSALERLRELASVVPAECFDMNPIAVCEMMSHADKFAYCPFTYGYSNYSRPGYAPRLLEFGSVISVAGKRPASTMLGGTGLAVSTYCKHRGPALEYTMFVASSSTQRGIYFDSGGQPAHRFAWLDDRVNEHCNNYFRDTLSTLDAAFVRPRYDGYLAFQDQAGYPIHKYLRERGDAGDVLDGLNRLYYESHGKK